jgi:hypothetical protein
METNGQNRSENRQPQPFRLRLPGFLIDEEIGLGEAIKRATFGIGLKPCGGCEERATVLDRWVRFTR